VNRLEDANFKDLSVIQFDSGKINVKVTSELGSEHLASEEYSFTPEEKEGNIEDFLVVGDGTGLCKSCGRQLLGDDVSLCGDCAGEERMAEQDV